MTGSAKRSATAIVTTIDSLVATREEAVVVEVAAVADEQTETATTPTLSRMEGTERWQNAWDYDRTLE